MAEITLAALAKVNLYLKILGKRADGYHELESAMQKVSLADQVTLRWGAAGISFSCPGSLLPADESNLAFRAARLFFERTGLVPRVEIVLEKRIPVAAGLGGGSSDAAAVLTGLNRLYEAGVEQKALLAWGATLGADVPFFVGESGAAWATGRGDQLQALASLADCWLLLVNPGFPVATKWVYDTFALTTAGNPYMLGRNSGSAPAPGGRVGGDEPPGRPQSLPFLNDLEAVTVQRFPELGAIKEELLAMGAAASLMSGSGPTVFGLFRERVRAESGCENFKKRYKDVFLTRPC